MKDWHLHSSRLDQVTLCGLEIGPWRPNKVRWSIADLRLVLVIPNLRNRFADQAALSNWCEKCMEHPEAQMMLLALADHEVASESFR